MAGRELRRWAREAALRKVKRPEIERVRKWNIVRGDKVEILSGRDAGKQGIVTEVVRKKNRLIVEKLNSVRKHVKPSGEDSGGVFSVEAPVHYSNVNLVDPVTGKPTRIAWKFMDDGTKVRVAKRSGAIIPRPEILKTRRTPKRATAGAKDTGHMDAHEKTFKEEDLLDFTKNV